jgi:hypothetical protein
MITFSEAITALEELGCKPKHTKENEYRAKCPVHGGKHYDTLTISQDGDVILATCHSKECKFHEIMSVISDRVDSFSDHYVDESLKPDAIYKYTDEEGNLLYEVLRYNLGDGKKTFKQRRVVDGELAWSLGDTRKPLYKLPLVVEAIKNKEIIFFVEGEKDVHTLLDLGLTATTSGSWVKNWMNDWSRSLTGAKLIVIPDNDDRGNESIKNIKDSNLNSYVASLKTVSLPEGKDVTDWINLGHTKEELIELCKPKPRINVITATKFFEKEFQPKETIIHPWLKKQDLVMVHAWRGVGKTWFNLMMAACIASGRDFFEWDINRKRSVLYMDGEMPANLLQERLAGISLSLGLDTGLENLLIVSPEIQYHPMQSLRTTDGQMDFMDLIECYNPEVVFLDNLSCLYGGDENEAQSWDSGNALFINLRRLGVTAFLVHHTGKGGAQRGTSKREDILSSVIWLKEPSFIADNRTAFEVRFQKDRSGDAGDCECEISIINHEDGLIGIKKRTLEDALFEQVQQARNLGLSKSSIANELKIGELTLYRILKELDNEDRDS